MTTIIRYILAAICVLACCGTALPEDGSTVFGSYTEYEQAIIEDPLRKEWQKPEKVVSHLLIKSRDRVADIGASTGYFTVLFSEKVGRSGRVYAVDIDKGMLKYLKERARKEKLENIEYILSPPDDPLLPKSSMDLIFICDTYFYLENRSKYLQLLKIALKEDGRIVIISVHMKNKPELPPPPFMRLSREKVIDEFLNAGFKLETENFFLPHQYFLIFTR